MAEEPSKFGNASVLFDGAGDYLAIPINTWPHIAVGDGRVFVDGLDVGAFDVEQFRAWLLVIDELRRIVDADLQRTPTET